MVSFPFLLNMMGIMTISALAALMDQWTRDPSAVNWHRLIVAEKLGFVAFGFIWMGAVLADGAG